MLCVKQKSPLYDGPIDPNRSKLRAKILRSPSISIAIPFHLIIFNDLRTFKFLHGGISSGVQTG